ALEHAAAPTDPAIRAIALLDGYRARDQDARAPEKLRRDILAGLKQLQGGLEQQPAAASPPGRSDQPGTQAPDARRHIDTGGHPAAAPTPGSAPSPGYHAGESASVTGAARGH